MRLITKLQEILSTTCLAGIVLTILVNILSRAVLNRPILWGIEATSILVIWMVYLVFGINYHEDRHFSIDLLKGRLPARLVPFLDGLKDLVILVTLVFSVFYSVKAMRTNIHVKTMALNVSVSWFYYLAFLIGSASMLAHMALKVLTRRKRRSE